MTSTARLNAQPEAADDEPLVRRDMTGNVVAIVADADLLIASRIMAARRVRHLPVMDGPRCLRPAAGDRRSAGPRAGRQSAGPPAAAGR